MATLTRPARRPQTVSHRPERPRAAAQPPPTAAPPPPTGLDELVEHWWKALEASESAHRAAARLPGGRGMLAGVRSPGSERAEVIRLFQQLEHELHQHSRLLPWLARAGVTNRMLGLPHGVRACLFDLDGVLTMSGEVHAAAWAETFERFLLEQADLHHRPYVAFDPRHDYDDLLAGRPRLDGVRLFLGSRGISLQDGDSDDEPGALTVHGLANRKNQLLQRRLSREGVAAFSGSRSFLEVVRMAGLACAVISPSANTGLFLKLAGLESLIDAQIDGAAIDAGQLRPKPAPDTLVAACRRLEVEPPEAVAFETTLAGIAAARAAGIGFVVAVHRHGDSDLLRASDADAVVGDLSDLLGVDGG
jgi:HAD superfamily hydrolase (TIGR01509 family)